jgi:hypothetical protein
MWWYPLHNQSSANQERAQTTSATARHPRRSIAASTDAAAVLAQTSQGFASRLDFACSCQAHAWTQHTVRNQHEGPHHPQSSELSRAGGLHIAMKTTSLPVCQHTYLRQHCVY